jgi:hypothetical protein
MRDAIGFSLVDRGAFGLELHAVCRSDQAAHSPSLVSPVKA